MPNSWEPHQINRTIIVITGCIGILILVVTVPFLINDPKNSDALILILGGGGSTVSLCALLKNIISLGIKGGR